MRINKSLVGIVLASAAAIGLSDCETKPEYIHGTVQKESGTIIDRQRVIEGSECTYFDNKSVGFGEPNYAIQFRADDGELYTFQIKPLYHRLEALNMAIEQGTRIRIKRNDFKRNLKGNVGNISDNELEVL
ncbi:MAG: hypothetical protein KC550_00215 [Nanoarchaeota archaeon]|nr:hypothetical protein [Nanoarchaeota archaeon]